MTKHRLTRAVRALLRFPVSSARRIREQAEKEDLARASDHFAALDNGLRYAPHHLLRRRPMPFATAPARDDPLERLWRLPARDPHASG